MANKRVTELTALDGDDVADNDLLMIVDVSDPTMAATGTNKRITVAEFATDSTLGGAFVAKSTLTTDGDMLTRAAGVPARITRADLAQDSAFSSRYQSALYKFKSGYYYHSPSQQPDGTIAHGVGDLIAAPFPVHSTMTFDRIGLEVTTSAASGVVRLGIYGDSDGIPGSLILDAGTVDASTTGAKEITISQQLTPGMYYLAAVGQVSSGIVVRARSGGPIMVDTSVRNANVICFLASGVTGALSASPTWVLRQNSHGKVYLRAV